MLAPCSALAADKLNHAKERKKISDNIASIDEGLYLKQLKTRVTVRSVAFLIYHLGLAEPQLGNVSADSAERPWQILRYQRVLQPELQPYPLSITQYVRPATFETHLRYLAKNCNVISLQALIEALVDNTELPARTVVITLDNGWIDQYSNAAPLLKRYKLPATFLIPTSFIGTENLFWPEKVMAALLTINDAGFPLQSLPYIEQFFPDVATLPEPDRPSVVGKIGMIIARLKQAPLTERLEVLVHIGEHCMALGSYPVRREFMNWEEVLELSRTANFSIGSTGHTGAIFSELSDEDVILEVQTSYKRIVDRGIRPSMVFAFPRGDITKSSRELLRKLGLKFGLGVGELAQPTSPHWGKGLRVLGRIPMYEEVAYCKEVFVCRLWRKELLGIRY